MATEIYIVIFANGAWWVDLNGKSIGPYAAIDDAIGRATERATRSSARGGRSEVRVMAPGQGNRLVYQSTEKSLLGRAVALNH